MIKMYNFSLGPVMEYDYTRLQMIEDIPYFRTDDFSNLMKQNTELFKKCFKTRNQDKVVYLTGSGTLGMESAIANLTSDSNRILVINGGSFGKRFHEICLSYNREIYEYWLNHGEQVDLQELESFIIENKIDTICYQACETSTGIKYPLAKIGQLCKQHNIFSIVDGISAFLADEIPYESFDALIIGSQKALALPPGMCFVYLKDSEELSKRLNQNQCNSIYMNYTSYLKDIERGQTPFTPAVQTCIALNERLHHIDYTNEILKVKSIAEYFRLLITKENLPMIPYMQYENMSNCCTILMLKGPLKVKDFIDSMIQKHRIWLCPNGSDFKTENVFRVGHIGNITKQDIDYLVDCMKLELQCIV